MAAPEKDFRILVVDDNRFNQELAAGMLSALGHKPDIAASGPEALEKVAHASFDLILMDLEMPGMDGLETTQRLRNLGIEKPIIALTAHARGDCYKRCIENGMNDFVAKPIDLDELREKLARHHKM